MNYELPLILATGRHIFYRKRNNNISTTPEMEYLSTLWPIIISNITTVVITVAVSYVSFINKLRIQVTLLEHRVEKSEKRLDRKSQQIDEIVKNVPTMLMEVKNYVQEELTDLKSDFAEVKGDVKSLAQTLKILHEKG